MIIKTACLQKRRGTNAPWQSTSMPSEKRHCEKGPPQMPPETCPQRKRRGTELVDGKHGYVVSKLSQYLKNPGIVHWRAAIRVLQYLEGTKLVGLRYTGGLKLEGMCNSLWGGDLDGRRS